MMTDRLTEITAEFHRALADGLAANEHRVTKQARPPITISSQSVEWLINRVTELEADQ